MTRRLLILILALASCACNRSRNIPDDELVAITRDIFLSNAFRESLLSGIPMTDSVDIYTPIFEKYGYEPEDFNYTVRNLSKRKSVRFTDIIDEVTASLAREDSLLQKRVALLDTIDRRIDEQYRQTVYEDSSRRVVRTGDLMDFLSYLLETLPQKKRNKAFYDVTKSLRFKTSAFYAPGAAYQHGDTCTLLRNPHIARNEELQLSSYDAKKEKRQMRHFYFRHLTDLVMVDSTMLAAERLGGADYDGDMVKTIADPILNECVRRNYEALSIPREIAHLNRSN